MMISKKEIKKLRDAKTVISMAIHPDTGQFIPWPMRMSSFIPMNIPISFGLIVAAPTTFNTIFWLWISSTYAAGINYGNRNASSVYTQEDIAKSYTAATLTSCAVSLGIRKVLNSRTKQSKGVTQIIFNSISSYIAISTAGFINT